MQNTPVNQNLRNLHQTDVPLFPETPRDEIAQLQRENEMLRRVNKGLRNRLDLVLRRAIEMRKMYH
jgi:hypothetical protein